MYLVLTKILKNVLLDKPYDNYLANFELEVKVSFFNSYLKFDKPKKNLIEGAENLKLSNLGNKYNPILSTSKNNPKSPKNDPSHGRYSKFSTPR